MATLEDFIKSGRLGPVSLGMGPVEVMTALGDPDEQSDKLNPLILKYGPVEFVFLSKPNRGKQDLRDIAISYWPRFKKMPKVLRLSDWNPSVTPSEDEFEEYLKRIKYSPAHRVSGEKGTQLEFLSGIVATFAARKLHSIRLSQRELKVQDHLKLEDHVDVTLDREPSPAQIREMLAEADRAMEANAPRAALMTAWAGFEAALRRAVRRAGGQGRIGVTPAVLLRELYAAKELSEDDYRTLENVRQLRTSAAHGLSPILVHTDAMIQLSMIAKRLLGPSLRKKKEIGYIYPVDAVEVYSVLANTKHARLLTDFLRSKGLSVHVEENAIGGDNPQHDLQIAKTVDFDELNTLISEWREQFQNS